MGGLTEPSLDEASQTAIRNASAKAMNLAITSITYLGATFSEQPIVEEDIFGNTERRRLQTYEANAITKTAVPLGTTGYDNATALYNQLTKSLDKSVSDGSFTSNMQKAAVSLGSTQLENAEATGVTNSALILLVPPSNEESKKNNDDDEDELNGGEIAGIVIGVIAFVALLAGGVWYVMYRDSSNKEAYMVDENIEIDL